MTILAKPPDVLFSVFSTRQNNLFTLGMDGIEGDGKASPTTHTPHLSPHLTSTSKENQAKGGQARARGDPVRKAIGGKSTLTQLLSSLSCGKTEHKICHFNHFKAYNSGALIIFTTLCNQPLFPKLFCHSKQKLCTH